jgi:hypothetical protein
MAAALESYWLKYLRRRLYVGGIFYPMLHAIFFEFRIASYCPQVLLLPPCVNIIRYASTHSRIYTNKPHRI